MPEGDTVHRAARRLHEVLAGREVTRCDIRVPAFATVDLSGQRVHEVVAGRPFEDRETAVLRRDERGGIALIVDELRGGEMPRPAELIRIDRRRRAAFDGLGHQHALDLRAAAAARDLRPEGDELVALGHQRRAVDGRQARA